MLRTEEREHARLLRHEGRSMKEIAQLVGASLSSVSYWVRDVPLTEDQRAALRWRNPAVNGHRAGGAAIRRRAQLLRQSYQAEGRALARRRNAAHAAGCMLFWAEGSRRRNTVVFTNSDPAMMRYFVAFLQSSFGLKDEAFTVNCNLFADHAPRQSEIEQFWLDTVGLPASCLRASTVNVYSKHSKKKRTNKLPYGTARVCVHSTRVVQSLYGSIQEYAGFERPEWLD
jgi:hypothetical protein